MAAEELQIRYVRLETLELWSENPKQHDFGKIRASINRYGFKDPPRFEPDLNGGQGGIVEGNGRVQVLRQMKEGGEEAPRGVALDKDGAWLAPTLFGVDARSESEAQSYGIDHNSLTLAGAGFGIEDMLQIWDEEGLRQILEASPDVGEFLTSFEHDDLASFLSGPAFEQLDGDAQPKLDRKKEVTCPQCGHGFAP